MKPLIIFMVLGFVVMGAFASDITSTNDSEAVQQEKLFQRFLKDMREMQAKAPTNADVSFMTNYDTPSFRQLFKRTMVVDPSFGYRWDEVPSPTMTGSNAMEAVSSFVATNGWNMHKHDGVFMDFEPDNDMSKPIRGLPWTVIHDREFPAVTHNGILYVLFKGWHWNDSGVAYNPNTNTFDTDMAGFKPIGQHWYVWATTDSGETLTQEYQGAKK